MKSNWKMIKRIFQYLIGPKHFGIFFSRDINLLAYSDADYGGDLNTRHSTTGVLIFRGPIVWYAQKQHVVATSTAETEYRTTVSAIDEVCWIRHISKELGLANMDQPIMLKIDNQSAIHMLQSAYDGKITKGKKHIEIARKFIQEHIGKTVKLNHVNSTEQLADILTKPLTRNIFIRLRSKIIKEEC